MTTHVQPQCIACVHMTSLEPELETCAAFPDGIPRRIWQGEADHREPYRGDNGIRFEQDPAIREYDFALFRVGIPSG